MLINTPRQKCRLLTLTSSLKKEKKARRKAKGKKGIFLHRCLLVSGYWTWYMVTVLKEPLWFIESICGMETLISRSYLVKRNMLFRCMGIPSICQPSSPNLVMFCTPWTQRSFQGCTELARPTGCRDGRKTAKKAQTSWEGSWGSSTAAGKPKESSPIRSIRLKASWFEACCRVHLSASAETLTALLR